MIVQVTGRQKLDYFSRRRNKQVTGVSLHFVRKPTVSEQGFEGHVSGDVWLPQTLIDSVGFVPEVDSKLELIYDFDGRNNILSGYRKV